MRERGVAQRQILETITDALFERVAAAPAPWRLAVGGFCGWRWWWSGDRLFGCRFPALRGRRDFGPPAHLTKVNNRSQRTSHGQRQISQAWVPSLIEKKMICARPMMLSYGT